MINKLKELILENPELPILVMANECDCDFDEFSSIALNVKECSVEELYLYDNKYVDAEDLEDLLRDNLADLDEFKNLDDRNFDEAVVQYMKNNYQSKEYIIIWTK